MKTFDEVKQERKEAARLVVINTLVSADVAVAAKIGRLEKELEEAYALEAEIYGVKDNEELTQAEAQKLLNKANGYHSGGIVGGSVFSNLIVDGAINTTKIQGGSIAGSSLRI